MSVLRKNRIINHGCRIKNWSGWCRLGLGPTISQNGLTVRIESDQMSHLFFNLSLTGVWTNSSIMSIIKKLNRVKNIKKRVFVMKPNLENASVVYFSETGRFCFRQHKGIFRSLLPSFLHYFLNAIRAWLMVPL